MARGPTWPAHRLLLGSDAAGVVTHRRLHLDGTSEAAKSKPGCAPPASSRLSLPRPRPWTFDATANLLAHFTARTIDNLLCDSPLGSGRIRLTGNLPGEGGQSRISVELDRISLAAGLDALRTVRSDLAPGLEVKGSASGKNHLRPR